ncbi:MAG: hypothetical protein V1913_05570, partial [Fibrobacterota bacterium]
MRIRTLIIAIVWMILPNTNAATVLEQGGRPGTPLYMYRLSKEMYDKEENPYQLYLLDAALFLHAKESRYLDEYLDNMPRPIPMLPHVSFMETQHGLVFALSAYFDLRPFCSPSQRKKFEDSLYSCLKLATASHWHSHGQNAHIGYVCIGIQILESGGNGAYDTKPFRKWVMSNRPIGGSGFPGYPAFERVVRVSDDATGYAGISWINYYWCTRAFSQRPVNDTCYARAYAWWVHLTTPGGALPDFGDTWQTAAYNQYLVRAALDLQDRSLWTMAVRSLEFIRKHSMPMYHMDYDLLYRGATSLTQGPLPKFESTYLKGAMFSYAEGEAKAREDRETDPWPERPDKIVFRDGWEPDDA